MNVTFLEIIKRTKEEFVNLQEMSKQFMRILKIVLNYQVSTINTIFFVKSVFFNVTLLGIIFLVTIHHKLMKARINLTIRNQQLIFYFKWYCSHYSKFYTWEHISCVFYFTWLDWEWRSLRFFLLFKVSINFIYNLDLSDRLLLYWSFLNSEAVILINYSLQLYDALL